MRATLATMLALVGALAVVNQAEAQKLGASLTVGTNGPGLMLSTPLSSKLNLRFGGNFFNYSYEGTQSMKNTDVQLQTDAHLKLFGGALDWFPGGGAFRMSVGAMYNGMEGDGLMFFDEPFTVGDRTYTPEEIGDLAMNIKFDSKIAPFATIGFGNAISHRVGFTMEMGAMYMGPPALELKGTKMLEPMSTQSEQIEENLDWVRVYPILSIGLTTKLF